MEHRSGPLLTLPLLEHLRACRERGDPACTASFDLGRTMDSVVVDADGWAWHGRRYAWPGRIRERTIYHHDGHGFVPAARYSGSLIKLVPTSWGAPTFEIDGIKMLPTAQVSPFEDARRKVALVGVHGKHVLDTCGGLGYFAACCLEAGAARIRSFEKNADVLWLRTLNPWSPDADDAAHGGRLELEHADVAVAIGALADASFDAILHDPPRFGIAGELYSQAFYDELARVIRRGGKLFHYTGMPNRLTSGRDLPREVARRLGESGFRAEPALDGVLAVRMR
ncbi:MAG: SAM-dependent methyltransferase [Xanthomonadales bacterium]|nr:SAM-dependent methyltransferase [Xanthomonadales bacterium]